MPTDVLPLADTQARIALIVSGLEPELQQKVMEAVATAYAAGWRDCEVTRAQAGVALRSTRIN